MERNYEGTPFERLVASSGGRLGRVLLGAGISAGGFFLLPKPANLAVAALGLVPIVTGAFNLCPIAPAWGGHFRGQKYCRHRKP